MKKIMQAGICPSCGKQDLDYDEPEFNGTSVLFNFVCNTCKATGYEESSVTYLGTVVNNDEEGEIYYDADTEVTIVYKRSNKK